MTSIPTVLDDERRAALSRVLVVANGKGGAGKTSVSLHLAGLSAQVGGWRVLLIDLDPQGNAGQGLSPEWPEGSDEGQALVDAVVNGKPLEPSIREIRPRLDFVCGGARLDEMEDVLAGRARRSQSTTTLLAEALVPAMADYDLVVIDTPPTRPALLQLALAAARWIVIPTRSDRWSINGLHTLTRDVAVARSVNPTIEVLGAALIGVNSAATSVRRNALTDINDVLDGIAPAFNTVVRYAEASANEVPEKGMLAHELDERQDSAEPVWKALREGRTPERVVGSMGALARDYALLVHEILQSIASHESDLDDEAPDGDPAGADASDEPRTVSIP